MATSPLAPSSQGVFTNSVRAKDSMDYLFLGDFVVQGLVGQRHSFKNQNTEGAINVLHLVADRNFLRTAEHSRWRRFVFCSR